MTARVPAGVSSGGQFARSARGESPASLPAPRARWTAQMADAAARGDGRGVAEAMAAVVHDLDETTASQLRARTYAPMDTAPGSREHAEYAEAERACSTALGTDRMLAAAGVASWRSARVLRDRDLHLVAQVAARALLARDKVGQVPGWDAAAYDRMTTPWRELVGPLHPDDPPITGAPGSTDHLTEPQIYRGR